MAKSNNLIGQKFGKLTVVEKGEENEDSYATWKCICDCGREIIVNSKRLKRGTITSCGCVPKSPKVRRSFAVDIIGQKFGKLTVVEKGEGNEDGYATWKCICDCGGEIIVNTKRLKRGTITSCGCIAKNPNSRGPIPVDLTGKRYGRLTVVSKAENRRGRTCWLCSCDCGNQCVVTTHELNAGTTNSCGCLRKEISKNNAINIANERFGRLVALYPLEKRDYKGAVYWHCLCDCGNEIDVTQGNLVVGHYKSCGCYKKEIMDSVHDKLTFVDNTCVELLKYRKNRKDNKSGFRGVYLLKKGKWKVTIGLQRINYNIGTFETYEEAVEARLEAERILHDGFVDEYEKWLDKARKDNKWAEDNPFYFKVIKTETGFIALSPLSRLQTKNL